MNHGLSSKYISNEDIAWAIEHGYWKALWRALNVPTQYRSGREQLDETREPAPMICLLVQAGSPDVVKAYLEQNPSLISYRNLPEAVDLAVNRGDISILKMLLETPVDTADNFGPLPDYPLASLLSVSSDVVPSKTTLELLLNACWEIAPSEGTKSRILSEYAQRDWPHSVRDLCLLGIDVNIRDDDGWTSLMVAATRGNLNTVRVLLDLGGDVNVTAPQGNCALSESMNRGWPEMESLLRDAGAIRPERVEEDLHLAILWRDMDVVVRLTSQGQDLELLNCDGWTPLMAAIAHFPEAVAYLIDRGVDIHAATQQRTPRIEMLYLATLYDRLDIAGRLLQLGADPNVVDIHTRSTALHAAVRVGNSLLVSLLIQHGANIEAKDKEANTPILLAAHGGHIEITRILIECGAELDRKNEDLRGPTDLLPGGRSEWIPDLRSVDLRGRHEEISKLIAGHMNLLPDNLSQAVKRGDLPAVERHLSTGADPNTRDENGFAAANRAVIDNRLDIAMTLLSAGANIDWMAEYREHTAVEIVALYGNVVMMEFVLQHGADPNATMKQHAALLTTAVSSGNPAMIEFLCKHGVQMDRKDRYGNPQILGPIDMAVCRGDLFTVKVLVNIGVSYGDVLRSAAEYDRCEIVRWCLSMGTDVEDRDETGSTPLMKAVINTHPWSQYSMPVNAIRLLLEIVHHMFCKLVTA